MTKQKVSTHPQQLMLINYVKNKEHILKSKALRCQNTRERLDFQLRLLHNDDFDPLQVSSHCNMSQNVYLGSKNDLLEVRCQVCVIL